MVSKFVLVLAIASVASAGIIAETHHAYHHEHHEQPANYDFNYEVHDTHTGDIKRQHEVAKDGHISGEYSLVEPDGVHRRVVTYTANDHEGFNAKVHREEWNGGHSQPAHITKIVQPATITKVIQPAVHTYAAPAHHHYSAPAVQHHQYVAPVQHHQYVAPAVQHHSAPSHTTYTVPAHQPSHQYHSSHSSNNAYHH